jgi:hypothetical protein
MEGFIAYWVVRDSSGHMVEVFDIGDKYQAECLVSDSLAEYNDKFSISIEYLQGDYI